MANSNDNSSSPRIAVAGVSGYAGAELARLLLLHPRITPECLLFLGRPDTETAIQLDALHPQLTGLAPVASQVEPFSWKQIDAFRTEFLFLATPHQQSREWAPLAVTQGLRVIDLSGAWRLHNNENRSVYNLTDVDSVAMASFQEEAVFGSPELHRSAITSARLVANPGCYSTSIILALVPLLRAELVDLDQGIICDSKSGVSGAGKIPSAKTHFMYAADNLSAYSAFGHRHTGELLEQLALTTEQIQFTPHLLPIPRGILSTIYLKLRRPARPSDIEHTFRSFYASSPMVRIRSSGTLPQIQHVVHTNFCDLGFVLGPDNRRMVLVSCLDNLLKGAAGQAVQNLNLMLGWGEAEGLS